MKRPRRLEEIEQSLKAANEKTDARFIQEFLTIPYLPRAPWKPTWAHPTTGNTYGLCLCQPCKSMTTRELDACFSLLQETSQRDYEGSTRGWNQVAKRKEMQDPDLRYILIKDLDHGVQGFISLMPTIEEGQPVIYCYEIHLKPDLRGTGLAKLLMDMLETVAYNIPVVEKVMLTVFTCNKRAVKFYQRCGFARDGISPKPRTLRGGKVKTPEYEILSKHVEHHRLAAVDCVRRSGVLDLIGASADEKHQDGDAESTGERSKMAKFGPC